ncbi:hypothetical protein J7I94_19670 [Streptomyces sp. ISL-12]|nr:hypothetical protein [Streptomyces sp. ISL-12]
MLLTRLLQDLLARHSGDEPVPVLFSVTSWQLNQPLAAWMAEQLRTSYPGLDAPAPDSISDGTSADLARRLVDTGRVMALLDGFDELPPALHRRFLDALNRDLPPRQPVVLASRTASYRTAMTGHDPGVPLNGAAAIQLLPVEPDHAADCLLRNAGAERTPALGRWEAVASELGTASPVGQALSTPQGLLLARTIYNARPGTPSVHAPHPSELCDRQMFPHRSAVDQYLFRAFIQAPYAADAPGPPRWSAEQAHRTFVFLAHFLEHRHSGSPDLAWWELPHLTHAPSHFVAGLALGGIPGAVAGLVAGGLSSMILGAVLGGVAVGFLLSLVSAQTLGKVTGVVAGVLVGGLLLSRKLDEWGIWGTLAAGVALLTLAAYGAEAHWADLTLGVGQRVSRYGSRFVTRLLELFGGVSVVPSAGLRLSPSRLVWGASVGSYWAILLAFIALAVTGAVYGQNPEAWPRA